MLFLGGTKNLLAEADRSRRLVHRPRSLPINGVARKSDCIDNPGMAAGRSLPPVIAKLLTALPALPHLILCMVCSGSRSGRRVTLRHEPGEQSCRTTPFARPLWTASSASLEREPGIPHVQALDEAARKGDFQNFRHARGVLFARATPPATPAGHLTADLQTQAPPALRCKARPVECGGHHRHPRVNGCGQTRPGAWHQPFAGVGEAAPRWRRGPAGWLRSRYRDSAAACRRCPRPPGTRYSAAVRMAPT